ncbi:MAG: CDP-glycerol:glycerophosphate glycerophosphotransferase, partial [Betaproteobacteria bacterium]|nr:CDP-glycerol:glycerophosphate glycerophosphotransferase [Betaproteobacteria bacterium]
HSKDFLFSVVVPTYNVQPWLDAFFTSLIKQSCGLGDIVQVIIVDDGSTDGTPALAQKWAARYPDNILYVRKGNGGLSSARNYGLQFVKGRWVAFCDPDDFLHEACFATVKNFLERSNFDGIAIGCNLIMYNEATCEFSDSHPLNFKFKQDEAIADLMKDPELVQLSAASCFLNFDALRQSGLLFDGKVQPTFEDAHLINRLFIQQHNYKIAYLKNAVYYYRRRQSANSLFTSGWNTWKKYKDQLFFGYLDLIKYAREQLGLVPEFIQNLLIYDTRAYINRMLDNKIDYSFSKNEVGIFIDLLTVIYQHIEAKHILFSKLPMLPWRTRITMLGAFKHLDLPEIPVLVHEIAPDAKSMLLIRYGREEARLSVYIGGQETRPLWEKTVCRTFYGVPLCVEQYLWVPISEENTGSLHLNGQPVGIIAGKNMLVELTARDVRESFYYPQPMLPERVQAIRKAAEEPDAVGTFGGCWLFMDRQDKADDNAEHLYRWVMHHAGGQQKIYYALDRRSPDWDRLAKEGFKLLPHKSRQFYLALFNAEWVISSHYHPNCFDPLYIRDAFGMLKFKFAFLQHGIIKDDMSAWFLPKRMDLFITTSKREYDSLVHGNYKFTERETVLTGLPRHDALLRKRTHSRKEKILLVCPTWRDHLSRPQIQEHMHEPPDAAEAAAFMQCDYYRNWNALTSSEALANAARTHGYKCIFLPHPYSSRFSSLFIYSACFRAIRYSELVSLQDLLAKSAMLVTDYSSLGMEAAFAGLALAYYQFKETPDFFSSHTYVNGYFDYEADGFGPVTADSAGLVDCLARNMETGCKRPEMYEARAKEFFTLRDGKNCARVFDAVISRSQGRE